MFTLPGNKEMAIKVFFGCGLREEENNYVANIILKHFFTEGSSKEGKIDLWMQSCYLDTK